MELIENLEKQADIALTNLSRVISAANIRLSIPVDMDIDDMGVPIVATLKMDGNEFTKSIKEDISQIKSDLDYTVSSSTKSLVNKIISDIGNISEIYKKTEDESVKSILDEIKNDSVSLTNAQIELSKLSKEDVDGFDRLSEEISGFHNNISKSILDLQSRGVSGVDKSTFESMITNQKELTKQAMMEAQISEELRSYMQDKVKMLEQAKEKWKTIAEYIETMVKKPSFMIGSVTIGLGFLVNKIADVNKELGLTLLETNKLSTSIMGLQFLGFSDAAATASELANQLGGVDKLSFSLQLKTNILASNLGISGDAAASLVGQFTRLNGGSTAVAMDMMRSVKETSKLAGVIPSQVMKDLANNTEAFALYGKQGGKNIAEAAVFAAKLGVGMDKLTGITENLLDFESSITSELELSAMLGRNINLERARQLAYEDDIQGAVNETLNQLGGIEAFNKMDRFQKIEAAKLLGISVAELKQMAENQHKVGEEINLARKGFDAFNEGISYASNTLAGTILQSMGGLIIGAGQLGIGFSKINDWIKSSAILTKVWKGLVWSVSAPFKAVGSIMKNVIWKPLTGMAGLIKSAFTPKSTEGFFNTLKSGFETTKNIFSSLKDSIVSFFKSKFGGGAVESVADSVSSKAGERLRDDRGRFIKKPSESIASTVASPDVTDSLTESSDKIADVSDKMKSQKSIGDKLKDLADGLKEMGSAKVLAGALNLIPTGIGLLLMLPGIPSLLLLSKIDVSSVGKGLGSLGEGLDKMGSAKVLFGALNLAVAGTGFALMTLGIIGMGAIALLGIPLGAGLTAMSAGLTAMGNPAVFMGALGILAVGAALIPFTFALSLLKGVDIGVILSTVGALVVFGIAAATIGSVLPLIAMGALGIGLIGLSLIPLTYALSQLQGVDMGILLTTAASLMVFGVSASMLGVLYPLIIAGSVAIGVLGLALIPFTSAMAKLQGVDTTILKTMAESMLSIASASVAIATGLGMMSVTLLGFGAIIPILLLGSVAFMVFGTSLMMVATASAVLATTLPTITESLKQLTDFTEGIYNLSGSILALAGSMTALSLASLVALPFLPIIGIIGAIASPVDSSKSDTATGSGDGGSSLSSLESTIRTTNDALLMEIKGLREDLVSGKIGVNMDGDSVTSRVTKIINRSTQNVTGLKV
jgi:hypothetical protein